MNENDVEIISRCACDGAGFGSFIGGLMGGALGAFCVIVFVLWA